MKYCLHCLRRWNHQLAHYDQITKCEYCGNESLLEKKRFKYVYDGKSYSNSSWYRKINLFTELANHCFVVRLHGDVIHPVYIRAILEKNTRKSTIQGLILPSILFFFLSLLSLLFIWKKELQAFLNVDFNQNVKVYFYFFSFLLFFFGTVLMIQWIRGMKIYATYQRGQARNVRLRNQEYLYLSKHIVAYKIDMEHKDIIYFKPLEVKEYQIREFIEHDAFDIYDLLKEKEVCQYLGRKPMKHIYEAVNLIHRSKEEYQQRKIHRLAIIDKKEHKAIGYIGLSKVGLDQENCEVVYALNKAYWGKGIMVIVLKEFVEYLIQVEHKSNIIGTHMKKNIKSGKVLLKAGFDRCETLDRTMKVGTKEEPLTGYRYIRRIK